MTLHSRLATNKQIKVDQNLQTKTLYEMFFKHTPLIPLSHPYIFLRRKIQVYSEFTLKEPYLVPFFLPFHDI